MANPCNSGRVKALSILICFISSFWASSSAAAVSENEFNISEIIDTDTATNEVSEDASLGDLVALTAYAEDKDFNASVSYYLADSVEGAFSIHANTGQVRVAATLLEGDYVITVGANSSDASPDVSQEFTITVKPVPFVIDFHPDNNEVEVNDGIGATVGITAVGWGFDDLATVFYELSDNAGGKFSIHNLSGVVSVDGPIVVGEENITVKATSSLGGEGQRTFTIYVFDNANLWITSSDRPYTNENDFASVTITADDPLGGGDLSYTIIGGEDAAKFKILLISGALSFVDKPDYENPVDQQQDNKYQVTVEVDNGPQIAQQMITVEVLNVIEIAAILDTDPDANIVAEDVAIGSPVQLTGFSKDIDPGQTVSYDLTKNDKGNFKIDSSTGVVTVANPLDFEKGGAIRLIDIRATSTGGENTVERFQITVTDVNEFEITSNNKPKIDENTTDVIDVEISDPAGIKFSITGGNDASFFQINTNSGVLVFTTAPNFETPQDDNNNNSYEVVVKAVDYFTIVNSIDNNVSQRAANGRIQEIDGIERTIVVGGIKYFYGPATIADPLRVRMLGVDFGALELLRVGMFVEVHYLPGGTYRIAKAMIQIEAQEQF
ncbi:MAG: cadherin repeat domain-containing protein [bacterium]